MKKCLIYGNCQTSAIRHYFRRNPDFMSSYSLVDIKPVHLLSEADVPYLEEVITKIDLLIHQNVSDNYREIPQLSTRYLKDKVSPGSQIISLPVAYFTGYNPEMIHMKNSNGLAISEPFSSPYHDSNILRAYVEGKSVDETLKIIKIDNFYSLSYVEDNLMRTLANLRSREKDFDIKLSNYIEDNFRRCRLFHTFNHPTPTIISFICNSVLKLLRLPDNFFSPREQDVLARDSFPIYSSLAKHLGINFSFAEEYRFDNKIFSIKYTIEKFFDFYEKNPEIVNKNLEKLSDLSSNPWVYGN